MIFYYIREYKIKNVVIIEIYVQEIPFTFTVLDEIAFPIMSIDVDLSVRMS